MNEKLAARTKTEITKHGGIYALSKSINVNPGVIYRAKNGGNSPTLRKLWKVPKGKPRTRINIDTTPEIKQRFDSQRGAMSRAEYLARLLELANGELPY